MDDKIETMRIGIGIDTGGTYTDAVAYDFESKTVLATGKSLTTGGDISQGILNALDKLPEELKKRAEIIGLSTTLVTNACVQDRLGHGKLIFFGDNREAVMKYGHQYGLPDFDEILFVDMKSDFSGRETPEADWAAFDVYVDKELVGVQGVGILEMNAMRHAAVIEKEAARRIGNKYPDIKIVCGHELFDMLNSLQRGASTLLNVCLLPVMESFLTGFGKAVKERGIKADTVIMRSDGSLMNEAFAADRPIETVLCGPAASLMGGAALTGCKNCIVVDMGGTTTDIAIMHDGLGDTVTGGVRIGRWKTFADGLFVRTFGLGGDTAIHYKSGELVLEDYRVMPISLAAKLYPGIAEYVKKVLPGEGRHTRFLHEHLVFSHEPKPWMQLSEKEKDIADILKKGPLSIRQISEASGTDLYSLPLSRLISFGVVTVCGLTPTDIMHIRGDFEGFDAEAAEAAAEYVACNLNISVEELCDKVYEEIRWRMYRNILLALMERRGLIKSDSDPCALLEGMLRRSFEQRSRGEIDNMFNASFTTAYPIVGIGAPIHVFLPDVARLLGTEAIIPAHHEVANALGAIAGSICATGRTRMEAINSMGKTGGYIVFAEDGNSVFENEDEALAFAIEDACGKASKEAKRRGACFEADIKLSYDIDACKTEANGLTVDLGTTVTARAFGNIR